LVIQKHTGSLSIMFDVR